VIYAIDGVRMSTVSANSIDFPVAVAVETPFVVAPS
jgi:hypothetical protein